MKPIIEIEGLSKRFVLDHDRKPYLSIRDSLTNLFNFASKTEKEIFWALEDVSFSVEVGESIGIIGKNGAGKSTLLKILSKITPPTKGTITSRGRIASLLEVGTGFHPELTGRENIFLNGSILGMKRREIVAKFDEIIDFSGVEQFLDTPLKHYSSGMQLRLAFAVAAFLEPEILVIDEVLAVGDAEFQKKCLGKMEQVSKDNGRTIIFVSHNMNVLSSLCTKCVYLERGRMKEFGPTDKVISSYLKINEGGKEYSNTSVSANKPVTLAKVVIDSIEDGFLILNVAVHTQGVASFAIDLRLKSYDGTLLGIGSLGTFQKSKVLKCANGFNEYKLALKITDLALGMYYMSVDLTNPGIEYYERIEDSISFEVNTVSREEDTALHQNWNCGSFKFSLDLVK